MIDRSHDIYIEKRTTSEVIGGDAIRVKITDGEYQRRCNGCGVVLADQYEGSYCKDKCVASTAMLPKKIYMEKKSRAQQQYDDSYRDDEDEWFD